MVVLVVFIVGFCNGYGCEVNAKSSSMASMIPLALDSGNCELRIGLHSIEG